MKTFKLILLIISIIATIWSLTSLLFSLGLSHYNPKNYKPKYFIYLLFSLAALCLAIALPTGD